MTFCVSSHSGAPPVCSAYRAKVTPTVPCTFASVPLTLISGGTVALALGGVCAQQKMTTTQTRKRIGRE